MNNKGILKLDLSVSLIILGFIIIVISQTYSTACKSIELFRDVVSSMGNFEEFIVDTKLEDLMKNKELVKIDGNYMYIVKVIEIKENYTIIECEMYKSGDLYEKFKKIKY